MTSLCWNVRSWCFLCQVLVELCVHVEDALQMLLDALSIFTQYEATKADHVHVVSTQRVRVLALMSLAYVGRDALELHSSACTVAFSDDCSQCL